MRPLRSLPYLLLALVLGAVGFAAGMLLDPLESPAERGAEVTGNLDPEAERLIRQIARLRAERAELAAELELSAAELAEARRQLASARTEIQRLRRPGTGGAASASGDDAPPQPGTAPSSAAANPPPRAQAPQADTPDAARPQPSALDATDPNAERRERVLAGIDAYRAGNYAEAYRLWLPQAQAGVARAQFHLGALFFEGRGVPQNDRLAYAWLTLAQENGSPAAGALLRRLADRIADADREAAIDLITGVRG
jgi:TPR repeat protein